MEEQKLKHVCKFCKKSFACGRSLGGHIRSHLPKPGYELRENPKKTWRSVAAADHEDHTINSSLSSSSNETENLKLSKVNKNHGKRSGFARNNSQSSVSEVVEAEQHHQQQQGEEEVVVAMCLIMLSRDVGSWGDVSSSFAAAAESSDNMTVPQGKSSRRRRQSVSAAAAGKKYESAASGYLQKGLKMKGIEVTVNGFGFGLNDQNNNNKTFESKRKRERSDHVGKIMKMETAVAGYVKDGVNMKDFEVLENGFVSNDQNKQNPESKRKCIGQSATVGYVRKGLKIEELEVSENGISSFDQKSSDFDSELYNSMSKRSKFECTTCNKVFHSYQALGGHRASHKKLGGARCSPLLLKLEAETETDVPAGNDVPLTPDHQQQPQPQQQQLEVVPEVEKVGSSTSSPSKKVVQKHECPICFRVFPSGQALGGHKRSHLLVSSSADVTGRFTEVKINNQTSRIAAVVERLSSTESTRDLLDLNFPPAPVQDETATTTTTTTTAATTSSSASLVGFIKPYWCVESSHKHEPLLGLISN